VAALTPRFAALVHRQGLEIMTYACNVPRQALHALRAGADVILTDDPGWLLSYLSRMTPNDEAQI